MSGAGSVFTIVFAVGRGCHNTAGSCPCCVFRVASRVPSARRMRCAIGPGRARIMAARNTVRKSAVDTESNRWVARFVCASDPLISGIAFGELGTRDACT